MKLLSLALLLLPTCGQGTSSQDTALPIPVPVGSRVTLPVGGVATEAVLGAEMILNQSTSPPTLLKAIVDAGEANPWIVIGSVGDWGGSTIPPHKCVERSLPAPGAYPNERLATGYPPVLGISISPSMYTVYGLLVVKLCNVGDVSVQSPNGQTFSAEIMRR